MTGAVGSASSPAPAARRAKVLTVSDGVVAGTRDDASGRALVDALTEAGFAVADHRVVADGVNALRDPARSMLVITHYQRLLEYIVPDRIHVLAHGMIRRSGGPELAHELEKTGYAEFADGKAA